MVTIWGELARCARERRNNARQVILSGWSFSFTSLPSKLVPFRCSYMTYRAKIYPNSYSNVHIVVLVKGNLGF